MNGKFTLGRFINNNSWMHKVNPVTKLIAWFFITVALFVIPTKQTSLNYIFVLLCLGFVIEIIIISCKINFFSAFYNISPLLFLIIFSSLLQIFYQKSNSPNVLVNIDLYWSPITITITCVLILFFLVTNSKVKYKILYLLFILAVIFLYLHFFNNDPSTKKTYYLTKDNVYKSIFFFLRIVNVVLISSLLTFTTSTNQLNYGIKTIFSPLQYIKLPVEVFSMMITLSLRFMPILFDEMIKISKAQKSRGVDYKESGLILKIKTIQSLLIPIFVLSLKKADELAYSMEARSFVVNAKRTTLDKYDLTLRDAVVYIGASLILTFAVSIRIATATNLLLW